MLLLLAWVLAPRTMNAGVFYPISRGKPARAEVQKEFLEKVTQALEAVQAKVPALALGKVELVSCSKARGEIFDEKKKASGSYENFYPWKAIYVNLSFPKTGECLRDYFEPDAGNGFSVYATRVRGQITLLGAWTVPEVI